MTIILGINAYHGDSSAALLVNGKLIAAVEEERFLRIKHWAGVPTNAVRYCLEEASLDLADVDIISINQDSKANRFRKLAFVAKTRPSVRYLINRLGHRSTRARIDEVLSSELGSQFKGELVAVEHHEAHLSSAFHLSPFDTAVVVSVDGFGDFASAAWGTGDHANIDIHGKVYFPHSLGAFYQSITQFIGFPNYGDEYKVMGLAPYGKPKFLDEMREIVITKPDGSFELNLACFRHHEEDIAHEWSGGSPDYDDLFSEELENLLGPRRTKADELTQRHFDIAHSAQAMYEEAFFNLLNELYRRNGLPKLALAGGCAMNSVANGKIYRSTPFKEAYIQAAAGDAGGAIGAAATTWHKTNADAPRISPMRTASLGPSFSNKQIEQVLDNNRSRIEQEKCAVEMVSNEAELLTRTAEKISQGNVIGWFQGKLEWGPRALGNRSILCDPRRSDMKEILNSKIKRRESFRPFAPSILREATSSWFEEEDDVPFMMKVFQIREEKRELIPAVTHVDGSGRLQTVSPETNPLYYRLIKRYAELTDVPILLNTSFNENEPIVCKPEEALDCFLRTKMDVLVMENWFLTRE